MTEEKKRDLKLPSKRMKRVGVYNSQWDVVLGTEHIKEDLFHPPFWDIVSKDMTPGDIINVRTDDGLFYGRYYVLSCGRFNAKLKELEFHDLEEIDGVITERQDFAYKWKGPKMKHCVVRPDGNVVISELPTKDDALKWIAGQSEAA